jgi:DNA-binding CsgD family transcriptional regulator
MARERTWRDAVRAAATIRPHAAWRGAIAAAIRAATSCQFVGVMTCPPGEWARGAVVFEPRELDFFHEEHVVRHVRSHGVPAPVVAPLEDLPLSPEFVADYSAALARRGLRGYVMGFILSDDHAILGTIALGATVHSRTLFDAVRLPLARVLRAASRTAGGALALAAGFQGAPRDPWRGLSLLTPREEDIAGLLCEGLADLTIGARLGISEETVGTHVRRIYRKLSVHTRSELVALLVRSAVRSG